MKVYWRQVRWQSSHKRAVDVELYANISDPLRIEKNLNSLANRGFTYTRSDRLGLVPAVTEIDDECCVFLGVSIPIMMKQAKSGMHKLAEERSV